jgi:exopolyphosphatase/guanosine-5'-triphosphate,3'-diphosphate pyrophosphatase
LSNSPNNVSEHSTFAAIDLGSNSFHMIVAQYSDGHLQVLDRLREMVRLAAGLDGKNNLDKEAQERALDCLSRFGQRLRDLPSGTVRAVGTNTLRKARSAGNFLADAAGALGHPIEVISGVEEARLIYLGVSHSLPYNNDKRLVVDIGGGSTELIIGRHFEPISLESLYMGCVSTSRQYFPNGVISKKKMERAMLAARLELQSIESRYCSDKWQEAVGASGTIKAVETVVNAMGWCEEGISRDALRKLVDTMVAAKHIDNAQLEGLKEERKPVFTGGVVVLLAIFEALNIEFMQVSDWALREGLIYDQVGRVRHEDVRERTIAMLVERYQVDTQQAQRVEKSALMALSQVARAWGLLDSCSDCMLGWAARLHEIGLAIAHNQYHKHGAYLLANSDMPGFSREDQRVLAALVRSHRRKFPYELFKDFTQQQDEQLQQLSILLRIAVLLHRSRSDLSLPHISYHAESKLLKMEFPPGWLAEHPLTQADLKTEARYLKSGKFKLVFE